MRGHHIKNRRDLNEKQIFDILRGHGFQVYPINTPCDAICAYGGFNYLIEVKNGVKAPLTPPQTKFIATWEGQHQILCTELEAIEWCAEIRKLAR